MLLDIYDDLKQRLVNISMLFILRQRSIDVLELFCNVWGT